MSIRMIREMTCKALLPATCGALTTTTITTTRVVWGEQAWKTTHGATIDSLKMSFGGPWVRAG